MGPRLRVHYGSTLTLDPVLNRSHCLGQWRNIRKIQHEEGGWENKTICVRPLVRAQIMPSTLKQQVATDTGNS